MKKMWVLFTIVLLAMDLLGENLITNGRFEAPEGIDSHGFWLQKLDEVPVGYNRTGGPRNLPSIIFSSGKTSQLRQRYISLVVGEKYKFSGYYKTKNFKASKIQVCVHSSEWGPDTGAIDFPANSSWRQFEKTFTAFKSKSCYVVSIYLEAFQGEIQFADFKLEALTEKGKKGSSTTLDGVYFDWLVPIQPLLNHILLEKPELTLRCMPGLPMDYVKYDVKCDNPAQKTGVSQDGTVKLNLKGLELGDHQIKLSLIEHDTGKKVYERTLLTSIVNTPEIDTNGHKELNNLVTEILNQPVSEKMQFCNPRDGWIFISLPDKAEVKLDGQDIYFPAGRNEAVRCLTAGLHTLDIDGIRDGNVVVRSIAEIFSYSAMKDSKIAGNGSYQWDFVEKYVAYALTTFNGGQLDPDKSVADEIQKLGFKWLTDAYIPDYLPGAGKAVKFDTIRGLNDPRFAGVTCNEFGFDDEIKLGLYSQMLHETRNVNNRLIYTWIGKKPEMWLHCDFMSNSLNASRGKGKLIYEAYCYSQSSEKEAQVYLDDYMVDTIKRFNLLYPNANSNTGMVLGLLTQIPIESRDWYPSVDYKYYLDMQMNMLANRKEFKNLSLIGVYGTHYADEELYRWAFKLMRHYAIDGKKTMLSSEYGFKYNPGFLKNCDFIDGMTGWDKTGTITTDSIPDYGKNIQNRRDSPKGTGDTFAKFKRGKSPNTLTQVASGLTVGKFYCLQFAVADYKDAKANIINPRLLGLNVELPGTEIVKGKSFIFVDEHPDKNNDSTDNQDDARINLHRIVFRSTASSQAVIFSDEQAKPGEELILNYVKLTPYFE